MTGTATDLWCLGAVELADVIRSGQASSREVVEPHLRRIEAVNPSANPVVAVLAEQALDAAAAADRALAVGGDLPPLHGVPFTVKENIDVAGTPTTQGLTALVEAYPRRDAPTVERLKAVGGIPVGRTNIGRGARRRWPFACGPTAAARASLGAGSGRPGGIVRPTLSLSRIGGVLVGAHWSALVGLVVLGTLLASTVLPELAPAAAPATYWVTGGTAVTLVGSLLAHELAHAVVARRSGLEVRRITLWLLGGVSELGGQPSRPAVELRVALAGPGVSIVLGVFFTAATGVAAGAGAPGLATATLSWLATVNVVLGVFNLLPGAPAPAEQARGVSPTSGCDIISLRSPR